MTNHTPGPWKYREDSHGFEIIQELADRPDYRIAYVYNTNKNKYNEAKARLIAAAPELYKHVIKLLRLLEQSNGTTKEGTVKDARKFIESLRS